MDWHMVIIWILALVVFDTVCIIVGTVRDNKRVKKNGRDKIDGSNGG